MTALLGFETDVLYRQTYMHGRIMQLAYKLWRQVRIVGDLGLHLFIC